MKLSRYVVIAFIVFNLILSNVSSNAVEAAGTKATPSPSGKASIKHTPTSTTTPIGTKSTTTPSPSPSPTPSPTSSPTPTTTTDTSNPETLFDFSTSLSEVVDIGLGNRNNQDYSDIGAFDTPDIFKNKLVTSNKWVIIPLLLDSNTMMADPFLRLSDLYKPSYANKEQDIYIQLNKGRSITIAELGDFMDGDFKDGIDGNIRKHAIKDYKMDFFTGEYIKAFVDGGLYKNGTFRLDMKGSYKDLIVCLDSYGNLVTNNGDIILPFWLNPLFSRNDKIALNLDKKDLSTSKRNYSGTYVMNMPMFRYQPDLGQRFFKNNFLAINNNSFMAKFLDSGSAGGNVAFGSVTAQSIPKMDITATKNSIIATYESQVKTFFEKVTSDAFIGNIHDQNGKKGYSYGPDPQNFGDAKSSSLMAGADASELLKGNLYKKINAIFDIGLGYLIHLSVASLVEHIYNFFLPIINGVFVTVDLKNWPIWQIFSYLVLRLSFVILIATILIAVIYRKFRGTTVLSEGRNIGVSFALLILPVMIYPTIVGFLYDGYSQKVAYSSVKQMIVLDQWINTQKNKTTEQLQANSDLDLLGLIPFRNPYDSYDIKIPVKKLNETDKNYLIAVKFNDLVTYVNTVDTKDTLTEFLQKSGEANNTTFNSPVIYSDYEEVADYNGMKASEMYKSILTAVEGDTTDKNGSLAMKLKNRENVATKTLTTVEQSRYIDFLSSQDILGIKGVLGGLSVSACTATNTGGTIDTAYYNKCMGNLITDLNKKVFSDYKNYYYSLHKRIPDTAFQEALNQVIALNLMFDIVNHKEYDFTLLPTKIEMHSINGDTFNKLIVIPIKEFSPSATYTENTGEYVGKRTNILTVIIFGVLGTAEVVYAVIKNSFLALFGIGIFIAAMVGAILRSAKKALIYGIVLTILYTLLVHIGFMSLWWFFIKVNNSNTFGNVIAGISGSFIAPVTMTLYLILTLMFVYKPLIKTVVKDWKNLGGIELSAKFFNSYDKAKNKFIDPLKKAKDALAGKDTNSAEYIAQREKEKREQELRRYGDLALPNAFDGDSLVNSTTNAVNRMLDEGNMTDVKKRIGNALNAFGDKGIYDKVPGLQTVSGNRYDFDSTSRAFEFAKELSNLGFNATVNETAVEIAGLSKETFETVAEAKTRFEELIGKGVKATINGNTVTIDPSDNNAMLSSVLDAGSKMAPEKTKEQKKKEFDKVKDLFVGSLNADSSGISFENDKQSAIASALIDELGVKTSIDGNKVSLHDQVFEFASPEEALAKSEELTKANIPHILNGNKVLVLGDVGKLEEAFKGIRDKYESTLFAGGVRSINKKVETSLVDFGSRQDNYHAYMLLKQAGVSVKLDGSGVHFLDSLTSISSVVGSIRKELAKESSLVANNYNMEESEIKLRYNSIKGTVENTGLGIDVLRTLSEQGLIKNIREEDGKFRFDKNGVSAKRLDDVIAVILGDKETELDNIVSYDSLLSKGLVASIVNGGKYGSSMESALTFLKREGVIGFKEGLTSFAEDGNVAFTYTGDNDEKTLATKLKFFGIKGSLEKDLASNFLNSNSVSIDSGEVREMLGYLKDKNIFSDLTMVGNEAKFEISRGISEQTLINAISEFKESKEVDISKETLITADNASDFVENLISSGRLVQGRDYDLRNDKVVFYSEHAKEVIEEITNNKKAYLESVEVFNSTAVMDTLKTTAVGGAVSHTRYNDTSIVLEENVKVNGLNAHEARELTSKLRNMTKDDFKVPQPQQKDIVDMLELMSKLNLAPDNIIDNRGHLKVITSNTTLDRETITRFFELMNTHKAQIIKK